MAMVAEDRKVVSILNILLSGHIAITLKASELLVAPSERVSFFVVAKRAQQLSQVPSTLAPSSLHPPYLYFSLHSSYLLSCCLFQTPSFTLFL